MDPSFASTTFPFAAADSIAYVPFEGYCEEFEGSDSLPFSVPDLVSESPFFSVSSTVPEFGDSFFESTAVSLGDSRSLFESSEEGVSPATLS